MNTTLVVLMIGRQQPEAIYSSLLRINLYTNFSLAYLPSFQLLCSGHNIFTLNTAYNSVTLNILDIQ
jgi:hypothetical protein